MNIFLTGGSEFKVSFLSPQSLEGGMIIFLEENCTKKCLTRIGPLEINL